CVSHVAVASLLGGLPAGLFLYRRNAHLFHKAKEGNQVFGIGVGVTIVGVVAAVLLPERSMTFLTGLGPVSIFLPIYLAGRFQREDINSRLNAGETKASYGTAIGAGLLSLMIFFGLAFLIAWRS